jgi:phosphate starvation-inducible membrane PsiE
MESDRARPSGAVSPEQVRTPTRERIAQAFTQIEDVLYIGLGLLLAVGGAVLLARAAVVFAHSLFAGNVGTSIISLLDQLLLVLMIVEVLYTVQISFREHILIPEPFILVAMIAGIRRVLVITAEFSTIAEKPQGQLQLALIELGLLTVMIGVFVACLVALRKRHPQAVAERA